MPGLKQVRKMAEYADFTGNWRTIEYEEENFIKFFKAMGAPDGKIAFETYKNGGNCVFIDNGDTFIFRMPDPKNGGGTNDVVLHVGKEDVVVGPVGVPVKKFTTRKDNWIRFEETGPLGKKSVTMRWLDGDKMTMTKTDPVNGIMAKAISIREPAGNSSL